MEPGYRSWAVVARFGLIVVATVLLIVVLTSIAYAQISPPLLQPQNIGDVTVHMEPQGAVNVFLSDESGGGIWHFRSTDTEDLTAIPFSRFQLMRWEGTVRLERPGKMVSDGKRLYVADSRKNVIVIINLSDHKAKEIVGLRSGSPIVSLAISAGGILAVARKTDSSIRLIDTNRTDLSSEDLNTGVSEPSRLLFVGPKLLIFDRQHNERLVHLRLSVVKQEHDNNSSDPASRFCRSTPHAVICDLPLSNLLGYQQTHEPLDLAVIDGRLLFLDKTGLSASDFDISEFSDQLPDSRRIGVLTENAIWGDGIDTKALNGRISADGGVCVLVDTARPVVRGWRFRKTSLFFGYPQTQANTAIMNLYNYLESKEILPLREYVLPQGISPPFKSVGSVLIDQKIILPVSNDLTFPVDSIVQNTKLRASLDSMSLSFCRSNQWDYCASKSQSPSHVLNKQIGAGQLLRLPDYFAVTERVLSEVNLSGRSVASILKERFPDFPFSSEYLMRVNRDYLGTLEYELTKRGYVLATAPIVGESNVMKVGRLIQVNNEGETQLLSNCPETTNIDAIERRLSEFRKVLRLRVASAANFPRLKVGTIGSSAIWEKLKIQRVEMSLDTVTEISTNTKSSTSTCVEYSSEPGVYRIVNVLKAGGIHYRFIKDNGLLLSSAETMILVEKLGLAGEIDNGGKWNLFIKEPFTLGYRVIDSNSSSTPLLDNAKSNQRAPLASGSDRTLEPSHVRTGGPQDIFSISQGQLVLPIPRWRIDVLASEQLLQPKVGLRAFAEAHEDKMSIEVESPSPRKRAESTPQSIPVSRGSTSQTPFDDELSLVEQNRKALLAAINANPVLIDANATMPDTKVGLFEKRGDIDFWHRDFEWPNPGEILDNNSEGNPEGTNDGPTQNKVWTYIWSQPTPHDQSSHALKPGDPVRPCSSSFIPEEDYLSQLTGKEQNGFTRNVKESFSDQDHGTFVAGLMSSTSSRAPGVLPGLQVYLYDLDNGFSCSFDTYMRAAMNNKIYVFNVSQKWPCTADSNDPEYCVLKNKIQASINAVGGQLPFKTRLFVVAAGNDGINLNDPNSLMPTPVSWAKDFPNNLLVVGAVNLDGSIPYKEGTNIPKFNYGMLYVDLLAPAIDIYSSSADSSYAKFSGTSFATPLVSAIAAKLFVSLLRPEKVKARLIYTSDWKEDYLSSSLGGVLNADRAISRSAENVFFIDGYPDAQVIKYEQTSKVRIKNTGEAYLLDRQLVRNGEKRPVNNAQVPPEIPFRKILRMVRMGAGSDLYRIVYLDKEHNLRILINARVGGTIDLILQGVPNKVLSNTPYNQLMDFISSVPDEVKFVQ